MPLSAPSGAGCGAQQERQQLQHPRQREGPAQQQQRRHDDRAAPQGMQQQNREGQQQQRRRGAGSPRLPAAGQLLLLLGALVLLGGAQPARAELQEDLPCPLNTVRPAAGAAIEFVAGTTYELQGGAHTIANTGPVPIPAGQTICLSGIGANETSLFPSFLSNIGEHFTLNGGALKVQSITLRGMLGTSKTGGITMYGSGSMLVTNKVRFYQTHIGVKNVLSTDMPWSSLVFQDTTWESVGPEYGGTSGALQVGYTPLQSSFRGPTIDVLFKGTTTFNGATAGGATSIGGSNGGCMYVKNPSTTGSINIDFNGPSTFTGCKSTDAGGAIWLNSPNAPLAVRFNAPATFSNNQAYIIRQNFYPWGGQGGAIAAISGAGGNTVITFESSVSFANNNAGDPTITTRGSGGAVYLLNTPMYLRGPACFQGNSAGEIGGAVFIASGALYFQPDDPSMLQSFGVNPAGTAGDLAIATIGSAVCQGSYSYLGVSGSNAAYDITGPACQAGCSGSSCTCESFDYRYEPNICTCQIRNVTLSAMSASSPTPGNAVGAGAPLPVTATLAVVGSPGATLRFNANNASGISCAPETLRATANAQGVATGTSLCTFSSTGSYDLTVAAAAATSSASAVLPVVVEPVLEVDSLTLLPERIVINEWVDVSLTLKRALPGITVSGTLTVDPPESGECKADAATVTIAPGELAASVAAVCRYFAIGDGALAVKLKSPGQTFTVSKQLRVFPVEETLAITSFNASVPAATAGRELSFSVSIAAAVKGAQALLSFVPLFELKDPQGFTGSAVVPFAAGSTAATYAFTFKEVGRYNITARVDTPGDQSASTWLALAVDPEVQLASVSVAPIWVPAAVAAPFVVSAAWAPSLVAPVTVTFESSPAGVASCTPSSAMLPAGATTANATCVDGSKLGGGDYTINVSVVAASGQSSTKAADVVVEQGILDIVDLSSAPSRSSVGRPLTFTASLSGMFPGAEVRFSMQPPEPFSCNETTVVVSDGSNVAITCTVDTPGQYNVTAVVTTRQQTAQKSVSVDIEPGVGFNDVTAFPTATTVGQLVLVEATLSGAVPGVATVTFEPSGVEGATCLPTLVELSGGATNAATNCTAPIGGNLTVRARASTPGGQELEGFVSALIEEELSITTVGAGPSTVKPGGEFRVTAYFGRPMLDARIIIVPTPQGSANCSDVMLSIGKDGKMSATVPCTDAAGAGAAAAAAYGVQVLATSPGGQSADGSASITREAALSFSELTATPSTVAPRGKVRVAINFAAAVPGATVSVAVTPAASAACTLGKLSTPIDGSMSVVATCTDSGEGAASYSVKASAETPGGQATSRTVKILRQTPLEIASLSSKPGVLAVRGTNAAKVTVALAAGVAGTVVNFTTSPGASCVPKAITLAKGVTSTATTCTVNVAGSPLRLAATAAAPGQAPATKVLSIPVEPTLSIKAAALTPAKPTVGKPFTVTATLSLPIAGTKVAFTTSNPGVTCTPPSVVLAKGTTASTTCRSAKYKGAVSVTATATSPALQSATRKLSGTVAAAASARGL